MNSPLLIENKVNIAKLNPLIEAADLDQIEEYTTNELKNYHKFCGKVITSLLINRFEEEEEEEEGYYAGCEFEIVTPDKVDLMELSINLGTNLISNGDFCRVSVLVRSKEGSPNMFKVFQVELTKEKLAFLTQDNGLDREYKLSKSALSFGTALLKSRVFCDLSPRHVPK